MLRRVRRKGSRPAGSVTSGSAERDGSFKLRPAESPVYEAIPRDFAPSGTIRDVERPLCETERYWVQAYDEAVVLSGRGGPAKVVIGDFYGNPAEAMIDTAER